MEQTLSDKNNEMNINRVEMDSSDDNTKNLARLEDKLSSFFNKRNNNKKVRFDIGGKIFIMTMELLSKHPDSLLYELVQQQKDLSQDIFLDRPYKLFKHILEYFNNDNAHFNYLNDYDLLDFEREALYYRLPELAKYLAELKSGIYNFKSYEILGKANIVGGNLLDILKDDKDMSTGVAFLTVENFLIIELEYEHLISQCKVMYFKNTTHSVYPDCELYSSTDKLYWKKIGEIPYRYDYNTNPTSQIDFTPTFCKYFKLTKYGLFGLSYLQLLNKS